MTATGRPRHCSTCYLRHEHPTERDYCAEEIRAAGGLDAWLPRCSRCKLRVVGPLWAVCSDCEAPEKSGP